MGAYFLQVLFAVLMFFSQTKLSIVGFKCVESERQALLNFKHGLMDDFGMLSTWKDGDNNRDCCKWKGIECNNETGHVWMLDLRQSKTHYWPGAIDLTSLIVLQYLEYVDLSYNYCVIGGQIPEHMDSFQNLRYLNLSGLNFGGRIPYELGNLAKLEYLDLSSNHFFGRIPRELGNLSRLEYLDLKDNSLDEAIPSQLGKLTRLRYLDLSYNFHLIPKIPFQLGNLSQLRYLDLWWIGFPTTQLSETIPFQVGNLPLLSTLRLDLELKIIDGKWLSSLSSLTTLGLSSFHNHSSSQHLLQVISKLIPNLRELRLRGCTLSDDNISSLFPSHSNISTSLSTLYLSFNELTSSAFQLLFNYSLNLQELDLSGNYIVFLPPHFLNFPSLMILDLSYNNMTSSIFHFNFSSKLQEIRLFSCSLTDNSFRGSSASVKNSSSSLVTLDLSYNLLKSSIIFHWISNHTIKLHSLWLRENFLEGPIPNGFGKVMSSLEFLDLSDNKLQGEIPSSIGNICTLQILYLNNNNLSGEISSFIQKSSWCNRHIFQILDLSYNQIIGMLPNFSIFTSFRGLYLSNNQLTGDIIESHLTNMTKLEDLELSDNSLSFKCGTSWVPPFQLFMLGLASIKLGPSFPSWLQTQKYLRFLDISNAGIDDSVPDWLWNKLHSIERMNMSHNNLKGTIPDLPIKLPKVDTFVILNSNQLEGGIPAFLSQAYALDLSQNKITDLNAFLCEKNPTSKMDILDLSNNQIMGQLPDYWEHLNSIRYLDLSNNKLSGEIPLSIGTLANLEALVLRHNSFIGKLPFTLKHSTRLNILDVSENLLSSPIPSWIGENLQQLGILSFRVNRFFGSVPVHLCYLRQIRLLDLSRNILSGGIPSCLENFATMMERDVITSDIVMDKQMTSRVTYYNIFESNVLLMWKGQEYVFRYPEILLKTIDLSSNELTGKIPKEVGYLLGLVSLNLSRNKLDGEIPPEIGNLYWLDFLDLSRNNFSGKIPSTLSKIDRLAVLDLSNNDLIGRIPWGRQLQNFDASSFEGNIGLCGEQINKSCPGDNKTVQPQGQAVHSDSEDDDSVFYETLYMSLGLGFFTGFWCLIGSILLWKQWRNAYLRFLNNLTDYIFLMVELKAAKCHRWLKG